MGKRDRRRIVLSFGQTQCGCGEMRLSGQPCVSCGRLPEPTEVDAQLLRRQRLVQHIRRDLRDALPVATPTSELSGIFGDVQHAVASLIGGVNRSLSGIGEEGFDEVAGMVRTIVAWRDEVRLATELRPARALRVPLCSAADSLVDVVDSLLAALDATALKDVQENARRVQPALDRASSELDQASDLLDAWRRVEEANDPIQALVELMATRCGRANLLDVAEYGTEVVGQKMSGVSIPSTHGFLGALLAVQASVSFDEAAFWSTAHLVHHIAGERAGALMGLHADPDWHECWSRSAAQALWSSERFIALSAAAAHDHAAVHAVLSHCHDLQEGLSKTVFSTLMCIVNPNGSFHERLAAGMLSLSEWAVAHVTRRADVFQVPTRNAFAHNDWRIDGDSIVLCELRPPANGPTKLTAPQLIDHLLAGQEVTLAVYVGLVTAMSSLGLDIPADDALASQSARTIASAVLTAQGWTDLVLTETNGVVDITATADGGSILQFACVDYLFPAAAAMKVHAITPTGVRLVELDLLALRRWSATTDATVKTLAFIEFLFRSTIDGHSVASTNEVRRAVAAVASHWITKGPEEHRAVVAVFKAARHVAEACGDPALLAALKTAQGWRRSRLLGDGRPVSDHRGVSQLGTDEVRPHDDVLMGRHAQEPTPLCIAAS